MTKPAGLPATLRTKLTALARRIRLLRTLRGLSLLTLTLAFLLGALFAADLLVPLPAEVLRYALLGIAGAAALVGVFGLVVPLCRRLDPEALAALIEQRYPDLGERLTTAVELADQRDDWHGSQTLIAVLIDETERRAHWLDFGRAFSARGAARVTLAALLALLAAGAPAVFWGDHYAAFGERLLAAWTPAEPGTVPACTFHVTPGTTHAARGRPLQVLALIHADHHGLPPATDCTLVCTDGKGAPVRVRMPAAPTILPALGAGTVAHAVASSTFPLAPSGLLLAGTGPRTRAFTHRFEKLTGDLPFYLEAGPSRSADYRVTAVDPVELAPDSPTITVEAPPYASKDVHPTQTLTTLTDLFAFEFGRVAFDLHFTCPAVNGRLDVALKSEIGRPVQTWSLPLTFTADCTRGRFEVPALRPGAYDLMLTLSAGHGITTTYDLRPLTVRGDAPPTFTRKPELPGLQPTEARPGWVVGTDPTGSRFTPVRSKVAHDQARDVAPGDTLRLKVAAEDAVGLDRIELEYRVNDGPSRFATIATGTGQLRAEPIGGDYPFKVPATLREGDVVLFRVRATDNRRVARESARDADGRRVPSSDLSPQAAYFPERIGGQDRWYLLRVSSKAEPLARQEILAQRDQVRAKVEAIQKKLATERAQLKQIQNDTRNHPLLTPEQKSSLQALRRDSRAVRGDLSELADFAAQTPALQPLADTAETVAREEMPRTEEALGQAQQPQLDVPSRAKQLQRADNELARAQQQLGLIQQQNEKLARDRLDQLKLAQLAARQQQLGQRAAELAAKDPMQDPAARQELDALRAEQDQVAAELKRLAQESDLLRNALDAARVEQAQQLADQAKTLAQAQRELNQASKEAGFQKAMEAKLAGLARKQQELADKAADLARKTDVPAKVANKAPLRPEPAKQAADALKEGNVGEAVQQQDQAAKEFERAAADFDRALELARDPREAARQLVRLQDHLRKQVSDEVKKKDPTPLAQRLQPYKVEQEAIHRAVKALGVPPTNQAAKDAQRQAADRTAELGREMTRQNPQWVKNQMDLARNALQRLADSLPSAEQRRQQALAKLADLRRQQNEIARQATEIARQAEKKNPTDPKGKADLARQLADAARRQAQVAERLSKLKLPGQEAPQQAAEKALDRALDGLIDPRAQDVPAAQQEARRELERLEQAVRAAKSPGEPAASAAGPKEPAATPGEEVPKQAAERLAQEQQKLAEATQKAQQQAAGKPGQQGKETLAKALGNIAKQQAQLNQQAARLDARKAQTGLQKARQAMNQAQQALARNDAPEARRRQQEAASALKQLARQLPEKAAQPQVAQPKPASAIPGLPTKEQTAEARQLAQQQKELRDAVEKIAKAVALARQTQPAKNPVGDLADKQRDLAKQAAELAKDVGKEQGPQAPVTKQAGEAAQQTQQAAAKAQAGAPQQAQKAGEQAAQGLRKLAQDLAQTPRGKGADPKAPDAAQRAAQLAQKQEELNKQLQPLAGDPAAQKAQQDAQQAELAKQAGQLARDLAKLGQSAGSPQAKQNAAQAAQKAGQGQQAMQQTQAQGKQGNEGKAAQAGEQAAQALKQAAQQTAQAAQQMQGKLPGEQAGTNAAKQTGESLAQGREQVGQAQAGLGKGQPMEAQGAMQKAAASLHQAAAKAGEQMARSKESGLPKPGAKLPGLKGAAPFGLPESGPLAKELKKYAGRSWGELPGELRTRILQDMRARYGEDYAGIIRRYFEQIADTNRARRR